MTGSNLHIEWASLFFDSLAAAGVRDVVISPGSRSTPLALAALRRGSFAARSIIDERSAGFVALGQGKVTGRPTLLLCTSGSAGSHYYPAVLEAELSFTPLLVLTADRPPELQGNAGPQTIDQVDLFGRHVRRFFALGLPDESADGLRALRRKAAQAYLATLHPVPGPVHLNAPFRKPLEPQAGEGREGDELARRIETIRREPFPEARPPCFSPDGATIESVASHCRATKRGLIVCGPAPIAQGAARPAVEELAETLQFPLLAEGTSQIRFSGIDRPLRCDAFDTFLRNRAFREAHEPQVILQVGAPPASKGWDRFVRAHRSCPRFILAPHGWNDPENSAAGFLFGPVEETVAKLKGALLRLGYPCPTRWVQAFTAADGIVWRIVNDRRSGRGGALTKRGLARTILSSLPPESILAIGNSLPVREIDSFCPGSAAKARVWSQKGINGIDGLVSGATGAAAADGGPVLLYLGDIAFLHDLHGLAAARGIRSPLAIVVAQNRGGRIFEQLPIAGVPDVGEDLLAYWTTPHEIEFSHAAALFGHAYRKVRSEEELAGALGEALAREGCTVIEAIVPASGAKEEHAALTAAVDEAFAGLPRPMP